MPTTNETPADEMTQYQHEVHTLIEGEVYTCEGCDGFSFASQDGACPQCGRPYTCHECGAILKVFPV